MYYLDLTIANDVKDKEPANTVFLKLMSLTSCIRDKKVKKSFYIHQLKIRNFLTEHINENNYHLFNNLFLVYVTLCAGNPENYMIKEPYQVYIELINGICSPNINEAIYNYSKFMSYYTKNFRPYIYPRIDYFYNDNNLSFYEMFIQAMTVDNMTFFSHYEASRKKIIKEFERNPDYYDVGSSTLAVAASYCMLTNNMDKFEEMKEYIVNNVVYIYGKMELNGLINNTRDLPEVEANIDRNKYIDFMIGIITNSNENNKVIH